MKYVLIIGIAAVIFSCSLRDDAVNPGGESRIFYLGFSTFPFDISNQAQNYIYEKISKDADLIHIYFDNGIPWNEALTNQNFHANIVADWQQKKSNIPANHKLLVTVTPLNTSRTGLALYKSSSENSALPPPWNGYAFNNPNVQTAYLNYCKRVIEYFNPDFLVIGAEVNLLISADQTMTKWNAYKLLHEYVYGELKKNYPTLPIMISFSGMELINGYTNANSSLHISGFNGIISSSDYFAVSLYPFKSRFYADTLPANLFDFLFSISIKPICVTETGFPAKSVTTNGGSILYDGSTEKQNTFYIRLFDAAEKYKLQFISNFVYRDFDKIWESNGQPDNISKVMRSTGLIDSGGNYRPAYETWKNKLNFPKQ